MVWMWRVLFFFKLNLMLVSNTRLGGEVDKEEEEAEEEEQNTTFIFPFNKKCSFILNRLSAIFQSVRVISCHYV